eukprot:365696-Chlamydomonas_euryale.AAC.5
MPHTPCIGHRAAFKHKRRHTLNRHSSGRDEGGGAGERAGWQDVLPPVLTAAKCPRVGAPRPTGHQYLPPNAEVS